MGAGAARWREGAGYAKGVDTRQTILQAAIRAFGEAGFAAVTTRQIAEAAGVNQPAIAYYFKNKEGLYLACAHEIIDRYATRIAEPSVNALAALEQGVSPDQARRMLKDVLGSLVDLMITSAGEGQDSSGFVEREMREPGAAYHYFYDNFWSPGIDLVARLIAVAKKEQAPDPACRAQAMMLIASLVAFTPGQSISLQAMGWSQMGPDEVATVLQALNRQIDAIA